MMKKSIEQTAGEYNPLHLISVRRYRFWIKEKQRRLENIHLHLISVCVTHCDTIAEWMQVILGRKTYL